MIRRVLVISKGIPGGEGLNNSPRVVQAKEHFAVRIGRFRKRDNPTVFILFQGKAHVPGLQVPVEFVITLFAFLPTLPDPVFVHF